jgi:hypothetical protein
MAAPKKIDADLLIQELYALRPHIDVSNEEAIKRWERIVELIVHAPSDEVGTRFPKLRVGR